MDQDHMHIDPAYAETMAKAGLNAVQPVLRCVGDRLAAWSRSTDTIEVFLPDGASVFIKRYHYPRWGNRVKGMFRGTFFGRSRVRSEFRVLQAMRRLGIQAVKPVAYGERRALHFLRHCFLITEAVPGSMSLATFAQRQASDNHSRAAFRRRREVLTVLARQIRHMHERRFVHGDLFWRNVLIRMLGEENCEFYFLDAGLGRRTWRRNPHGRRMIEDVAQLAAISPVFCTRADQVRFAKAYLDKPRMDAEALAWMRKVAVRAKEYREHESLRLHLNQLLNRHLSDLERLEGRREEPHAVETVGSTRGGGEDRSAT